jgi:uncharacterized oxidoreductase
MKLTGHKVVITGGGSGIGAGLAKAFIERGNKVVITGRREQVLREMVGRLPGLETFVMDVAKETDIQKLFALVAKEHPTTDVIINNAGIMLWPDFSRPETLGENLFDEIEINLKGLIRMTAVFLPLLLKQPEATLINVSSGLAYVPLASTPIYCATKAAVHSFSDSLRHQLRKTHVQVLELAPPRVETNLGETAGRPEGKYPGMGLEAFIALTMKALESGKSELPIGQAKFLRFGSRLMPSFLFKKLNPSKA